jgi:hypothetical protein
MKKMIATALLICAFSSPALYNQAFADKPEKPDKQKNKPKDPKKPDHHDAPFNGGLALLVVTGLIYGLKKAYDSRQQGLT